MTPERFAQLTQAYGADVKRWPADERVEACKLVESGNSDVRQALKRAQWLDQQLNSHRAPVPDSRLMRSVLASVSVAQRSSRWSPYAGWLSKLGIAGVGLAGIAAGMLVVSLSFPLPGVTDLLPSVFDHGDAEWMQGLDVEEIER